MNRLTGVNYGDGYSQSYTFDPMGNRLTMTDAQQHVSTYNNANMLLTLDGNPYTNDFNGNTLTGGGRTNTWDSQNRLRQCVYGGTVSQFTYGSDGLRRASNVNGTIRKYMLDNGMMVRETDANGVSQATYLAGLRGPEYRRDDVNGAIKWYIFDGLGSVLAEMDGYTGALTASRKLDVYGAPRATQGTPSSKHAFVGNLGHTTEPDTGGLVYMRARWMDPVTGRFVSEDPALQGRNWFQYCFSNPVNGLDQDGRRAEWQGELWMLAMLTATTALGFLYFAPIEPVCARAALHMASAAVLLFGAVAVGGSGNLAADFGCYAMAALMTGPGTLYTSMLGEAMAGVKAGQCSLAWKAVAATFVYGLAVMGAMMATDYAMEHGW